MPIGVGFLGWAKGQKPYRDWNYLPTTPSDRPCSENARQRNEKLDVYTTAGGPHALRGEPAAHWSGRDRPVHKNESTGPNERQGSRPAAGRASAARRQAGLRDAGGQVPAQARAAAVARDPGPGGD